MSRSTLDVAQASNAIAPQGRRRVPVLIGALGVFVVIAVVLGVVLSTGGSGSGSKKHLTLPKAAAGLTLRTSGKPLQQSIATDLGQAFAHANKKNIQAGVYADSDKPTNGVIVAGADEPIFPDPTKGLTAYVNGQTALAQSNNFPITHLDPIRSYPADAAGGKVACGSMVVGAEGIPFTVCAWGDDDTDGYALANDLQPAQLATTLAKLRPSLEK